MTLSRRQFLASSGMLAVSTLAPGPLVAALERKSAAAAPRLSTWPEVRAQFALAPDYMHFASFFIASHPRPVRVAIEDFRRTLDANPFLTVERGMFESEAANLQRKVCADVAEYLGGRPDEIALTGSTTMGLALVYHGLALQRGDEILTTTHDHYSQHESIRFAAERAGATVRKVALYDRPEEATSGAIVAGIREAVRPETRVVGVTWVHSSSGVRLPIRAIADALAEINGPRDESHRVLLVVDGVHGLGVVDANVADLGCDFFCAGTHKWMFGPRGTGIIWARADGWRRLRPLIPSFSDLVSYESWMREERPPEPNVAVRVTPGGFAAFEHQWGMGAAFRFHEQIGRRRVAARIRSLNDQCKQELAATHGVTVHTPRDPELSAGLVAFEVAGVTPEHVVARLLERRIVASASPYRVSWARLAPSLVNSPEEVTAAVREVRAIART